MLCELEKKVLDFIVSQKLIPTGAKVILAVSGGADSVALMHCLWTLKAQGRLDASFICVHLNHQLRAEASDADERFVIEQANKLGLDIVAKRLNVRNFAETNRLSIETAARQLRIQHFTDIARKLGYRFVATGHQKNDNAETVLFRLLRGTGYRGLGGIWPRKQFGDVIFIRPLLELTREQIVSYLKERSVDWRLDATNEQCIYKRNFIRGHLIPELQKTSNQSIIDQLAMLSSVARRVYERVDSKIAELWPRLAKELPGEIHIDIEEFLSESKLVQIEIIRTALDKIGSAQRDLKKIHYEQILELCHSKISGRCVVLPSSFRVYRQYRFLIFQQPQLVPLQPITQTDTAVVLNIPGVTRFGKYQIEAQITDFDATTFERFKACKDNLIEWFDYNKLVLPLVARPYRSGDRFVPLGMTAEKKISRFLIDTKIPPSARSNMFVVADSHKIIWLCPVRSSQLTRIEPSTRTTLQLKVYLMQEGKRRPAFNDG